MSILRQSKKLSVSLHEMIYMGTFLESKSHLSSDIVRISCNVAQGSRQCCLCSLSSTSLQARAPSGSVVRASDQYSEGLWFKSQLDPRIFPWIYFSLSQNNNNLFGRKIIGILILQRQLSWLQCRFQSHASRSLVIQTPRYLKEFTLSRAFSHVSIGVNGTMGCFFLEITYISILLR